MRKLLELVEGPVNPGIQESERLQDESDCRGGSNSGVGGNFQPFRINNLEMVAQISPRWNRVEDWLREAESYSRAT